MRRLALVVAVVAVGAGGVALAQRGPNTVAHEQRKFDHAGHAAAVQAKGKAVIACTGACHRGEFAGGARPARSGRAAQQAEHARCFSQCHDATHTTRRCEDLPAVSGQCIACHNPRDACLKPGLREAHAGLRESFAELYSHRKHTLPGASGRQCEPCHGTLGDRRNPDLSAGHDFCGGCHGKSFQPAMTECGACHVDANSAAGTVAVAPPRPKNPYSTEGAFDHARHANQVGPDGRTCLACHGNLAQGEAGQPLAMPTMQSCYQSCHDGRKAFSAVGTTCTRCHQGGPR